jgi:hydroxymethylpyrimidine pyrophosphatase-like HAD family hydrolase
VNSKKELSAQTLTTLLKIQHAGIRIVLASGRSPYGLRHLVEKLEMKKWGGYILPYNGTQIVDAGSGEVLFEKRIDPAMLAYLERRHRRMVSLFSPITKTNYLYGSGNKHIKVRRRSTVWRS